MNVCTPFNFLIWLPVAVAAAVVYGHLIVGWLFHGRIEKKARLTRKEVYGREVHGVPAWVTGAIERAVFAPAFMIAPTETAAGAFVWLGIKMAANWERDLPEPEGVEKGDALKMRRRAFLALMSSFLSLAVAAAVGLSIRGCLLWPVEIEMGISAVHHTRSTCVDKGAKVRSLMIPRPLKSILIRSSLPSEPLPDSCSGRAAGVG